MANLAMMGNCCHFLQTSPELFVPHDNFVTLDGMNKEEEKDFCTNEDIVPPMIANVTKSLNYSTDQAGQNIA